MDKTIGRDMDKISGNTGFLFHESIVHHFSSLEHVMRYFCGDAMPSSQEQRAKWQFRQPEMQARFRSDGTICPDTIRREQGKAVCLHNWIAMLEPTFSVA